jgi:hypothetical protein
MEEPGIDLKSTTGRIVTLAPRAGGRLFLFFTPNCTFCKGILEEAAVISSSTGIDVVVFLEDTHGTPDPYPGPAPVVVSRDVFVRYAVDETPHAIPIGPTGEIAGRVTLSANGQLGALAASLP